MGWPMLPLLALAAERGASPAPEPWDPPALVTVGGNATTTERYAAASLADRLRTTLGLAAARVETAGAATRGQPQLAVGFDAARLAAPGGAGQLHGLGDDGYVLLPLPQGGVACGSSSGSARGSLNAVYALLRRGGMRFLAENVTTMLSPRPALDTANLGQPVHPPLESREDMSRAALPCRIDHCPSNISAALGFNGPHAHAPGGVPQVMALQTQLANGAHVGDDNSDIYDILAAAELPLEPWAESHCYENI